MSVGDSWTQLRTVGAQARTMLVAAAASQWKVKPGDCRAEKGFVLGPGGRKASFGSLARGRRQASGAREGDAQGPEGLQAHRQAHAPPRRGRARRREDRLRHGHEAARPAHGARGPPARLRREGGLVRRAQGDGGAGRHERGADLQRRGGGGQGLLGGEEGPRRARDPVGPRRRGRALHRGPAQAVRRARAAARRHGEEGGRPRGDQGGREDGRRASTRSRSSRTPRWSRSTAPWSFAAIPRRSGAARSSRPWTRRPPRRRWASRPGR